MEKKDSRIFVIVLCEIVVVEVCYYRICYKGYIRVEVSFIVVFDGCGELLEDEYVNFELEVYQMFFDYIRLDVFVNEKIVRLIEMMEFFVLYLMFLGVEEIKLFIKKYIRWNFQVEFGDVFFFENLLEIISVFIVFVNLLLFQVVKYIMIFFLEKQDNVSQFFWSVNIYWVVIDICEVI